MKIMSSNNNQFYSNQMQLQQQYQYQQQSQSIHQFQQQNAQINLTDSNSKVSSSTNLHLTLLGLADTFQKNNQYRLAIHCLESILTLKHTDITLNRNFHIQLRTRISLCRLYLKHTVNTNQYVNAHLEKSLNANDEYKYEATYLIYKIIQKQKNIHLQLKQSGCNDTSQMVSLFNLELIKKILETSSTNYPVWHLRLLFLISDVLVHDRDFINAAYFMSIAIDYCAQNRSRIPTYTYILCILCKGLIHLLQRNPAELQTTMQPCASLIESFQTANLNQVESLKIFFLVLQVTYFIQCGQMKSVKNTLKNLQHYVQSLSCRTEQEDANLAAASPVNQLENFQWLHKDHLGILVYLLTVIHSVQTGSYDKAVKLIDKALLNIHKLKLKEQTLANQLASYNVSFVTNAFHFMLVENMIKCNITIGNRCLAINKIGDLFQLCDIDSRLMSSHAPQLHCLLGLYCLSMNLKEQALSHFNQALKTTNDTDLWLFNAMNSALCYLNSMSSNPNIKNQLMSIMDNLMPENIQTQNSALTAVSHYFRALKYFLNTQYQQAKLSLKEAILLANAEELMCIIANSYILMGHSDFLVGQFQESFDELNNGSDLSEKLSDYNLKVYSNTLLRDMFKYFNDPREAEMIRKFNDLEQKINNDYHEALKAPQHAFIEWNNNVSPTNIIANVKRNKQQQQPSMNQTPNSQSPKFDQHNSPIQMQSNQSPVMHQHHQQPNTPQTPQTPHQHYQQQQTPTFNNYTQQNNSPMNHQQMLQAQQRLNIMSPQQQYIIQQQQQQQQNKMSPQQQSPQINSQNYNSYHYQQAHQLHHQHQPNQQHLIYNYNQQQQQQTHHQHHHHQNH